MAIVNRKRKRLNIVDIESEFIHKEMHNSNNESTKFCTLRECCMQMQSLTAVADDSIPERDEMHKFIDVEDRTHTKHNIDTKRTA